MAAEGSGSGGANQGEETPDVGGDHSDNENLQRSSTMPGVIKHAEVTNETGPYNLERSRTEPRRQNNPADDPARQLLDDKISIRNKISQAPTMWSVVLKENRGSDIDREEDTRSRRLKMLNQIATVKDDGTVVVDIQSTPETAPLGVEGDVLESLDEADIPYCPPLQIVMLIAGTHGDVEIFVVIGLRLQDYGHRVRLATHANFKEFVLTAGLEFFPLEIMENRFPGRRGRRSSIHIQRAQIKEFIYSLLPACKDPDPDTGIPFRVDAIIANPSAYGHTDVAEALKVPIHIFSTMPWTPTREFPHPLYTERQPANYFVSYQNVSSMISLGTRNVLNEFRKRKLKLRDHVSQDTNTWSLQRISHAYIWSPHLVPKPLDWGRNIEIVGSIVRSYPSYKPPESLLKWLEAGGKPIYVNLQGLEGRKMTEIIVEALGKTGQRGIICHGTLAEPKGFVYLLDDDNCPHDWLFPRCKAVIHHGGAGITAAGLKATCPTTIVYFFGDRSFWGDRVHARLLGPAPIPVEELSLPKLVDAIEFMMNPQVKVKAVELAKAMASEDGATGAVTSFHKHLPRKANQESPQLSPSRSRRFACRFFGSS